MSERMTFEDLKEKANRQFGRRLSDREIAEVAIEQLNDRIEEVEALARDNEEYASDLSELTNNYRQFETMSDLERKVSDRICEVLSISSEAVEIYIIKNKDGVMMDFNVMGHPIESFNRCPSEDDDD